MPRANSIIDRLPHFYRSGEQYNLLYHFIGVFGALLDGAEEDLIRVMRAHYVDSANNEPAAGTGLAKKGDLDKIFTLYIESLGGTALLKQINRREGEDGILDDVLYRTRIKGLINVLKSGASTREGITRIVGANLGIVDDTPEAIAAREKILIKEYLPEKQDLINVDLPPYLEFTVINPNVVPGTPTIRMQLFPPIDDEFPTVYSHPGIVNLSTGEASYYEGTVLSGDTLIFFPDGTASLNGQLVPLTGPTPKLSLGSSVWRFEIKLGSTEGIFDQTLFDFTQFEATESENGGFNTIARFDEPDVLFDEAVFASLDPIINLDMSVLRIHPAAFMVQIPWDLPGYTVNFQITQLTLDALLAKGETPELVESLEGLIGLEISTIKELNEHLTSALGEAPNPSLKVAILDNVVASTDKFANMTINPRTQIKGIVNRVKAAGVYAVVAYEKRFLDIHGVSTQFQMEGEMQAFQEDQEMTEANFDIGSDQFNTEDQGLSDNLILSGAFDFAGFDMLNRFG